MLLKSRPKPCILEWGYEKVLKSHLLGSPTIVSTNPKMSKVVLHNDGRIFVPYPNSFNELIGKFSTL